MIRVLVFPVGERAQEAWLAEPTLKGLQDLVGGYLDAVRVSRHLAVYCHDEGLMLRLPPNRLVNGQPLVGQLVLSRIDDDGETVSITDEDVARWRDAFPMALHFGGRHDGP